ncbi:hypothetical protein [Janibacter alittae]|uniref:Uncharacterized protein n=1 Tax=Janibacter alittae TaxID=3115209 RepID=A0ABZ2MID2_9MICO
MRSIARYPEVRGDGSLWVPLAPPPAPTYRQLSPQDSGIAGARAVVSYSTEWLTELRVLTDPYEQREDGSRWVVQLCDEGAWHDFDRHGIDPISAERLVASVRLVFVLDSV